MMKIRWISLFAVLLFLLPLALLAEQPPKYDASAEVTLEGPAIYVAEHPSRASWTGIYLIMKESGGNEIEVHLAPDSYLSAAGIEIKRGDTVKITGARVRWSGTEIILAREVTVSGKTVQLREKSGARKW